MSLMNVVASVNNKYPWILLLSRGNTTRIAWSWLNTQYGPDQLVVRLCETTLGLLLFLAQTNANTHTLHTSPTTVTETGNRLHNTAGG